MERLAFADLQRAFVVLVFFFQRPSEYAWPHVLWTYNTFYKPIEGEAFPFPYDGQPGPKGIGTAYEVQHQSCALPYLPRGLPLDNRTQPAGRRPKPPSLIAP